MQAMTVEGALDWCSRIGIKVSSDGVLCYEDPAKDRRFFVLAPEEFREITVFARAMLTFRGEAVFAGGLVWLRRWDIGSPQLVRVGWQIIEDVRRAHGDSRPLEVAPAQLFRDDELVELQAFLVQVIGFGWVAEFIPATGAFFAHFRDNRQVCFPARSANDLGELRAHWAQWNPTDEDPMVKKLAEHK